MQPVKVLIVEDDECIRAGLLDYFTDGLKCETVAVADYKSAEAALRSFKPDLVVTDHNLGGNGNGLDVVRTAKAIAPHVSVVMVTASERIEVAVEAMKLGAIDFFAKPFNMYQFDLLIEKILKAREMIKTLEQIEAEHIEAVIAQTGSVATAAIKLGINPSTIWRKRKKTTAEAA